MLGKILISVLIFANLAIAETISLDKEKIKVNLKNNAANIINFPFIVQKASLTTENPEDFSVSSKNKSVVIIPTVKLPDSESGDLLIWSTDGNPYLLKLTASGISDQTFNIVSNDIQGHSNSVAARYETGRIDSDIKKLIKLIVSGKKIPGYKKVDVKRKFLNVDLEMQKDFFYDGGKYRVEEWYVKNISPDTLLLDYENFYTPGVLGISFEKKVLKTGKIGKVWLIINKHTIAQQLKKNHK